MNGTNDKHHQLFVFSILFKTNSSDDLFFLSVRTPLGNALQGALQDCWQEVSSRNFLLNTLGEHTIELVAAVDSRRSSTVAVLLTVF